MQHRLLLLVILLIILFGCSKPIIKMPPTQPAIVKNYQHLYIIDPKDLKDSGVYINAGDLYTILVSGMISIPNREITRWPLQARIGRKNPYARPRFINYTYTGTAEKSGNLYVGTEVGKNFNGVAGSFNVDIIVWEKDDYVQITDFFAEMKEKNPNSKAIDMAIFDANILKQVQLASQKASEEIKETKKKIQELKEEPEREKEKPDQIDEEESAGFQSKATLSEKSKREKITQLEIKLEELTATLIQLEEIKKMWEKEKAKSILLAKELEEKQIREQELLTKLEQSSKSPPVIVIASPGDGITVEASFLKFSGVAVDDQGIQQLEIFVNGKIFGNKTDRGIHLSQGTYPKRLDFNIKIPLEQGKNQIMVRAIDSEGIPAEKVLTVNSIKRRRNILAVVIGIDDYKKVRKLRYAAKDAGAFYRHLVDYTRIPPENVILLLNQDANLTKIRSTLGTYLKNKAGRDDMVIIYFAGHGATEKDATSPDGDGLEKYLLPYDVDPNDLYATALPMGEISRIFKRIQSERLIFIADSCYSGASGGRTIGLMGIRSNISDAFLDRITIGKGKIILTASGANEVSEEDEKLEHGVFTYYLLEGLRGKADIDGDGLVTVDEAYRYVSKCVPDATNQTQHPVKKGAVEGQLILSIVE